MLATYSIGDVTLRRTTSHKYLGVVIDDQLTFAEHVERVRLKCRQRLGVIRTAFNRVHRHALVLCFKALVLPLAEYALPIYFPFLKLTESDERIALGQSAVSPLAHRLDSAFRVFLRSIFKELMTQNDDSLFLAKGSFLRLRSASCRVFGLSVLFAARFACGKKPWLSALWRLESSVSRRPSRTAATKYRPRNQQPIFPLCKSKLTHFSRCFVCMIPEIWNAFVQPTTCASAASLNLQFLQIRSHVHSTLLGHGVKASVALRSLNLTTR